MKDKKNKVAWFDRQKFSNIWSMAINRAMIYYEKNEQPEFIRTVLGVKRTLLRTEKDKVKEFLKDKPEPQWRTDTMVYYWNLLEFIIDILDEAGYLKYERQSDGIKETWQGVDEDELEG